MNNKLQNLIRAKFRKDLIVHTVTAENQVIDYLVETYQLAEKMKAIEPSKLRDLAVPIPKPTKEKEA